MARTLACRFFVVAGCFVFAAALFFSACSRAKPAIPSTPDGTVTTIAKALGECKPELFWAALPESYQKDVQEDVVRAFAANLDPDVYAKSVALAEKLARILRSKKAEIIEQVMGSYLFRDAHIDNGALERNWDAVAGLVDAVLESELGDLDRLKEIDIGRFLEATGGPVMQHIAAISAVTEADSFNKEFREMLRGVKAEVVSLDGDKAVLKLNMGDEPGIDVKFVKVGGKWLPEAMVSEWVRSIVGARHGVASLDAEFMADAKPHVLGAIAMMDACLDQFAEAETPEGRKKAFFNIMRILPVPLASLLGIEVLREYPEE